MKTTLEKWLLFFGALLFCWLAVPELKASAADSFTYTSMYSSSSKEDLIVTHVVVDDVHAFHVDGYETLYIRLEEGQELCVFNTMSFYSYDYSSGDEDVAYKGLSIYVDSQFNLGRHSYGGSVYSYFFDYAHRDEAAIYHLDYSNGFEQLPKDSQFRYYLEISNNSFPLQHLQECILYVYVI